MNPEYLEPRRLLSATSYQIQQPPAPVGSVTGFELIDAATQQDLGALTNGRIVTQAPGQTLAVRASTSGQIGSVLFQLDGSYRQTENIVSYDLFGTAPDGTSQGGTLYAGTHVLSATPHAQWGGQGTAGTTSTVQFTIVPAAGPVSLPAPTVIGTVSGFELIDAATQHDLGPLTNGQTVTEAPGQTFALRATTSGSVGSIRFLLDASYTHLENYNPYDVFGTAADGTSEAGTLNAGTHILTAIPYAQARGQGGTGTIYMMEFNVVPETTPTPPPQSPPPAVPPPPPPSGTTTPPVAGNWNMIFDDEFSGNTLNPVWTPHQYWSNGATVGEGVEESDPANVSIGNGALHLAAKPDNSFGTGYTGALVQSGGIDGNSSVPTFSFLHGYIEARIKIPPGQGLWPAFWLMPASYHDGNGEIDAMEMLDGDPATVYGTTHRNGAQQGHTYAAGQDLSAGWHTFGVDWESDHITWYVDGKAYGTTTDPALICPEAMYPIFDLAVGGDWGGMPNANTPFPASMDVDYIRAWQTA